MSLKWLLFPTSPFLLGYETCDEYKMVSKIQVEAIATFLIVSGVHMNNIFIHYQSEVSRTH